MTSFTGLLLTSTTSPSSSSSSSSSKNGFIPFVILRDLAARNVLVREQSRQCVVSDFGMSRIVETEDGGKTKSTTGPLVTFVDNYRPDFLFFDDDFSYFLLLCQKWMSPEQLLTGQYSKAS
jgi:serine/threonine protein kinase